MKHYEWKRCLVCEDEAEYSLDTVNDVIALLDTLELREKLQEEFWAIYVNTKLKVIHMEMISKGTLTGSMAQPRDVFRHGILCGAYAIYLAHNHPSGDTTPSDEDIKATKQLIEAGKLIGIRVIEHIIIGNECRSMRMSGDVEF